MKNLPELIGKDLWFGDFSYNPILLRKYFSWLNNPDSEPLIGPVSETTVELVEQMLHENEEDGSIKHWCVYIGLYPSKENPVGDFSLKTLNSENEFARYDGDFSKFPKSEELTILIGQEYAGRGLGKKAMKLGLNHAFSKGANAVYLGVRINNVAAIGLYKKCNFTTLRQCTDSDGKEELIMKLTPQKWNAIKDKL